MADTTHDFDKDYWERHWDRRSGAGEDAPHLHLARETNGLAPGTALDAGCGTGAEAVWLAARGWHVTGADIAAGPPVRPGHDCLRPPRDTAAGLLPPPRDLGRPRRHPPHRRAPP
jgi:hypothetical protein